MSAMVTRGTTTDRSSLSLYPAGLRGLGKYLPDHSAIFIDEPDVMRKRNALGTSADVPTLRSLISWSFTNRGRADSFYNAHPRLRRPPSCRSPTTRAVHGPAGRTVRRPRRGLRAARALRDKRLLRQVTGPRASPTRVGARDRAGRRPGVHGAVGAPSCSSRPTGRRRWDEDRVRTCEIDAAWSECTDTQEASTCQTAVACGCWPSGTFAARNSAWR